MGHWWERDWLHRHAIIAPFGIFTATILLTWYLARWQWQGRASWEQATDQVDLGAVIYAMVAVVAEQGVNMVFWALQKRRERQEKLREEGREAGLKEGRAEGREQGRAEGREQGREEARQEAQKYRAQLELVAEEAREKGIMLESLPNLNGGSPSQ